MSKENYSLDEYRFAKEKIRKNEEKRFALITLNVTAFFAILGFSEKVDSLILPLALISVLIICSRYYTSQSNIQKHTTAFIIEKYEIPMGIVGYEHGINEDRSSVSKNRTLFSRIIKGLFDRIRDPFLLLCLIGLISTVVNSYGSIVELIERNTVFGLLYLFILLFLYSSVVIDVVQRKSTTLNYFREYWRNWQHNNQKRLDE